jgi:hypothetical protein
LRGKSIISVSIEILEQTQEMIRNGFFGDLVEHGANLPADMGLKGGGHGFPLLRPGRNALAVLVLPISAFPGVYGHAPGSLFIVVSVHSGSLSMLSANAIVTGFRRLYDPKNPPSFKEFQNVGNFGAIAGISSASYPRMLVYPPPRFVRQ